MDRNTPRFNTFESYLPFLKKEKNEEVKIMS